MSEYRDFYYENQEFSHTYKYLLQPILSILDKKKNMKILDVGCGNGWLTKILLDKGFDVYGIDASETGIKIARKNNPNRFFLNDITKNELPVDLKSIKFDTIISTEVIEHLYSPGNYLEFCKNILQRSDYGELIISTPYHGYFKNLLLALTGKMDKHFNVMDEGGHIKFWSKKTIIEALEHHGFKISKFIGCGRFPYVWKSMIIKSTLSSNPHFNIQNN